MHVLLTHIYSSKVSSNALSTAVKLCGQIKTKEGSTNLSTFNSAYLRAQFNWPPQWGLIVQRVSVELKTQL